MTAKHILVMFLLLQAPVVWVLQALCLSRWGFVRPVAVLLIGQCIATVVLSRRAGFDGWHPVPLLVAFGTLVMLTLPGQTWTPIIIIGIVYFGDLAWCMSAIETSLESESDPTKEPSS